MTAPRSPEDKGIQAVPVFDSTLVCAEPSPDRVTVPLSVMSTGLFTCGDGEILAPGGWFDARMRARVAMFAVWRWSVLNALSQRAKSQRM
jgi:hypothetical protein